MRVLIAPDSFKDALRAGEVAKCIAAGLRGVVPGLEIDCCPVADGGEGFASSIGQAISENASPQTAITVDPLGRTIESSWMLVAKGSDQSAIIELAEASGLERLADSERDPTQTSTFGTGALLCEALDHRISQLLLGIGGSATNDAGCGIAQALGIRFYDQADREIEKPITGGMLREIMRIDRDEIDPRLKRADLRIACDVTNPLAGPRGAAHTYGPQKGATPQQVAELDAGLRRMAKLWREQFGVDVEDLPGAGAAGGVGGGLVAMLGAEIVPGAELLLDMIGFDSRVKGADLIITGEGQLDHQSLQGKAAMAVAKRAQAAGVPCVALVGCVGEGAEQAMEHGLSAYRVIGKGLSADESIRSTAELLEQAAAELAKECLN